MEALITCRNTGCRKTFKNRMGEWRHLKSNKCIGTPNNKTKFSALVLPEGNNFICTKCHAVIKHVNNVARHVKLCLSTNQEKCPHCNSEFKTKKALNRHIQFVHEDTLGYRCGTCGNKYKDVRKYDQHITTCTSR